MSLAGLAGTLSGLSRLARRRRSWPTLCWESWGHRCEDDAGARRGRSGLAVRGYRALIDRESASNERLADLRIPGQGQAMSGEANTTSPHCRNAEGVEARDKDTGVSFSLG
jgi:hypothetical protein